MWLDTHRHISFLGRNLSVMHLLFVIIFVVRLSLALSSSIPVNGCLGYLSISWPMHLAPMY